MHPPVLIKQKQGLGKVVQMFSSQRHALFEHSKNNFLHIRQPNPIFLPGAKNDGTTPDCTSQMKMVWLSHLAIEQKEHFKNENITSYPGLGESILFCFTVLERESIHKYTVKYCVH